MTDPVEPVEPLDDPVAPVDPMDPAHAVEEVFGDGEDAEPLGPRRYPSTIGGACYLVILVAALVALGVIVAGDWRVGVRVLAGALATAAGVRLFLPQRDAGMLAVRHRVTDVLMLAAVAGLLWWLAGSIPDQPAA